MHTLTLKRVLGFTIVILLLLALFIWGDAGLYVHVFCFTGRYPERDFTQPTCGKRIC